MKVLRYKRSAARTPLDQMSGGAPLGRHHGLARDPASWLEMHSSIAILIQSRLPY